MTLNQLSYFYQAAVLEHFNQAAEKMNITEPSLSRSIAALEDHTRQPDAAICRRSCQPSDARSTETV